MSASIEHNTKRHRLRYLYAGATMFLASTAALGWRELARFVTRNEVTLLDLSHLEASRFAQRAEAPLAAEIHLTGARVPWRLRRQIQLKLSPSLYATYGASECGYIAIAGPGDHDEREIVGRPQPGVTVEIVAPDGTLLPRGEVGEIRVKAPGMIGGYVDDPVETAARFRGGWFHPGDMGSITPKGELIVHGRRDDMMIMNSINIYPLEVERVLETHPGVAVATAFAIKSRLHGDIPAAAVELAAGGLSEDDLMQYAQDRLGLRYPRKIVILDRMPRNTEGKILRGAIVAAYGGAPS